MEFLFEVVIFLAAAVVMVPIARRLGLGAVIGYLAAGILIGPWALGLIGDVDKILHFSELGIVLLLFVIGLELRPNRLRVLRRRVFLGGGLQMAFSSLILWAPAAWWMGDVRTGLLVAVVLSLSSTAIGLQMLAEKKQLSTPYGKNAFGVLLFQDIAVIPLLAIIPLFGDGGNVSAGGTGILLQGLQTAAIIAAIIVGGRFLLRPILRIIVLSDVREVFLAAVLLLALGTAMLADWAGLSMALGAFLAGVLLSDSEYRHELEAGIDPFKGLLLGLFFIAVGMSIDFGRVIAEPGTVLGIVAVMMVLKFIVLFGVGRMTGLDSRSSISLAFALPQAGEFAFVLFTVAVGERVLDPDVVNTLIAAVSVSMVLTPLMYLINEKLVQPRMPSKGESSGSDLPDDHGEPRVIIAGMGRVGQIVARNLSMLDIHFTALDFDQQHIEFVRRFGHRAYYGNATNLDVLRVAGAAHANLFVLTISDIEVSLATAQMVKRHFPDLKVHARARNRRHALELKALGVDYVMREAWLSSLDMARESLAAVGVRQPERYVQAFREHDEEALEEQVKYKDDFEAMLNIDRRSREELAELFEEDRAVIEGRREQG